MNDAPQERQWTEQAAVRKAFAAIVRRYKEQRARQQETSLAGYLCEQCQDAAAVQWQPAPEGGERAVCTACAAEAHGDEPPEAYVWPN